MGMMKSCLAFLTSALSTIPSNLQKVDESHLKKMMRKGNSDLILKILR